MNSLCWLVWRRLLQRRYKDHREKKTKKTKRLWWKWNRKNIGLIYWFCSQSDASVICVPVGLQLTILKQQWILWICTGAAVCPHTPDTYRITNLQTSGILEDFKKKKKNDAVLRYFHLMLARSNFSFLPVHFRAISIPCDVGLVRQDNSYFVQQVHLLDKFETLCNLVIFAWIFFFLKTWTVNCNKMLENILK